MTADFLTFTPEIATLSENLVRSPSRLIRVELQDSLGTSYLDRVNVMDLTYQWFLVYPEEFKNNQTVCFAYNSQLNTFDD